MSFRKFDFSPRSEALTAFLAQSERFIELARTQFPESVGEPVAALLSREPTPLAPIVIENPDDPSNEQRAALRQQFYGAHGVAHFAIPSAGDRRTSPHTLLTLARSLADDLPLKYPVDHPMEQHPEARRRFGESDGTLKLYNLEIPAGVDKYREQAETKEMFAAHNDGLGYGGAVTASVIALDAPPAWGGYTCFQQLVRLSLALAHDDLEAFRALFLPDAIVALRPRGKGAIRVTSPVLYVNERDEPQSFFRVSSGEYEICWRDDVPALARARKLLLRLAQPFAPSSAFVHLMHIGEGVIIRNTQAIHSRTPFEDDVYGSSRVLARKWFVSSADDQQYKHVPGMNVHPNFARCFPELFSPERLAGEWHYDPGVDDNVLIAPRGQ